ncbi:MAG: hypothetical protein R3F65_28525 [bacterium]
MLDAVTVEAGRHGTCAGPTATRCPSPAPLARVAPPSATYHPRQRRPARRHRRRRWPPRQQRRDHRRARRRDRRPRSDGDHRRRYAAHRAVQGTGSGADVAASALGGALAYAWSDDPTRCAAPVADGSATIERLAPTLDVIHAVWSGDSASTPALVGAVDAWRRRDPTGHAARIDAIAAAADAGIEAWRAGDRVALTAAAAAGRDALAALGNSAGVALWTETHRALDAIAARHGAVVKSTGAGGGDLAWLCGPDPATEEAARVALAAAGHLTFRFAIDRLGAR